MLLKEWRELMAITLSTATSQQQSEPQRRKHLLSQPRLPAHFAVTAAQQAPPHTGSAPPKRWPRTPSYMVSVLSGRKRGRGTKALAVHFSSRTAWPSLGPRVPTLTAATHAVLSRSPAPPPQALRAVPSVKASQSLPPSRALPGRLRSARW